MKSKHNTIGMIGLGKMGAGLALNLLEHNWTVHAYNRTYQTAKDMEKDGLDAHKTLEDLAMVLPSPRLIWLMVPAGDPVEQTVFGDDGVIQYLDEGDIVIDGGNSKFTDTIKRAKQLEEHGIRFLDAGVSGGPSGARNGSCIMIGGQQATFDEVEHLFDDLSVEKGYEFFQGNGAGHFVKMVHNGIEYGMMQAIAEGFQIMKESEFSPDLGRVASVYNHRSVIESRLVGWVQSGFDEYGVELEGISSTVGHTGEGAWTVETAKKMNIPAPIIEGSLEFRKQSADNPSYAGKMLSMIRNQFGGHSTTDPEIRD